MAPDADAGKSAKRADPFAPLTSEQLDVGDGHEIYVESVGRPTASPRSTCMAAPAAAASPITAGCSIPSASMPCCSTSAAPAAAAPRAGRDANTLPHLIADMETIREKFGFESWLVVGGSWGATLALAYAQAHPERVTGIVLRATFLGTRRNSRTASSTCCRASIPALHDGLPQRAATGRTRAADQAYFRRILDPDPAVHGPAARAWGETERILSEHAPNRAGSIRRR